jgi:predicted nicotinamide N-methyase
MTSRAPAGDAAFAVGVPGAEVEMAIEGVAVRLWRAVALERFVDTAALLGGDSPPEPPYWMHMWPGAVALARKLGCAAEVGPGARVLELGCGLGLPALMAARRGATVVASDREFGALAFAQRSARLNGWRLGLVQMNWAASALRGAFDVCIGADVGYDVGGEGALLATLNRSLASPGVVWLADSVNTARTGLADGLAAAGFAVGVHETCESEDGRPVWIRMIEARRR